jgi:hypothetical protein
VQNGLRYQFPAIAWQSLHCKLRVRPDGLYSLSTAEAGRTGPANGVGKVDMCGAYLRSDARISVTKRRSLSMYNEMQRIAYIRCPPLSALPLLSFPSELSDSTQAHAIKKPVSDLPT